MRLSRRGRFRHRDEPRMADGEWHWTADRQWEWKGDTSSDELVGHFYAFSVGYDLLPDGPIKADIRRAVTRIADHLIRHRYYLVDLDGQPTRWGRWGLDYFETEEGKEEQALRAVELLSHMSVAAHVTGEPRFRDGVPTADRPAPVPRADADVPVEPVGAELLRRGAGDAVVRPALPLRARRDVARLLPPRDGPVVAEHPARGQPAVDLHLRAGQPRAPGAAGPRGARAGPHAARPGDVVGAQRAPARRAARARQRPPRPAADHRACCPPTSATSRSGTPTPSSSTGAKAGVAKTTARRTCCRTGSGRYYGYITD